MKRGASPEAPAGRRRGRFVGPLLAANVLVVGVAVTLLTAGGLRAAQREDADRVMDQRTTVARAAVSAEAGRYLSLLRTVAAGIGTNGRFTGTDFDAATAPLDSAGLLGAVSVGFLVPSPRGADAATQAYWRERGATGLVLKPSGNPQEHFYSIFARSLNNGGSRQTGLDAVASTEASVALGEARRTGRTTVSDTYVLLRDRGLLIAQQQLSFAFVAPVYATGDDPAFRGWIVLGLHGQDFLGGVLGTAGQGQLNGELVATNGDGRQVLVAYYSAPGTPTLHRQAILPVANRQWTLVTRADAAVLPGARSNLPSTVLLGGVVVTTILAWLVYTLATGRSKARSQVRIATAELRTAEAASRRQAGLLSAIMASLGDGVGVVDGDGEFLLHNPAAKVLLGVPEDVGGPDHWQSHYGLFRPDGRTPFPVEEMPLVRALRGESSDRVEMLVRNSARPDGILLSVDGRPLDASAGQHGGVAVFHDITELRQYETDLSVFAGVVAHDLKAPLAIVRGHCETAVDELGDATDSPAVDEARAALGRIAAGVDRMAGLIDTLLAYTTSRDAPLHPRTVSLDELVADAVTDRIGHLRPSDGPVPDVYVGPLPDVDADPAMLRHVVDNLIGNSLKYIQAGRAARIDVTAGPATAGWTRVEVADRGIGIPDEDKPNIFESFHRAPTAAGYAGTGLGLAICRRIVERHGGAIGVTDNPGGGTRFHFTLPLASTTSTTQPAAPAPEVTMPEPYTVPDALTSADPGTDPVAGSGDRAALERALAERSAVEEWAVEQWAAEQWAVERRIAGHRTALPGMSALPATGPSAREPSAARLQAPVPDHHHGD